MKRAILNLAMCLAFAVAGLASAAAQGGDAGVWKSKSGALSLNFGAAGWVKSSIAVDGSVLVVAPTADKRSAPVCVLFAYPGKDMKNATLQRAASQADVNAFIEARGKQPGYTMMPTQGGVSISQQTVSDPKGDNFRDFWFATWEGGQSLIYNLSCGAPSAALLTAPNVDALAKAIALG